MSAAPLFGARGKTILPLPETSRPCIHLTVICPIWFMAHCTMLIGQLPPMRNEQCAMSNVQCAFSPSRQRQVATKVDFQPQFGHGGGLDARGALGLLRAGRVNDLDVIR